MSKRYHPVTREERACAQFLTATVWNFMVAGFISFMWNLILVPIGLPSINILIGLGILMLFRMIRS